MDVMRILTLIRKPLIKLLIKLCFHVPKDDDESSAGDKPAAAQAYDVQYPPPHHVIQLSSHAPAMIRAPGHLSARGTTVTPVLTFAATFPPFPCWMTQ